jgi:hypothetical protein
MDTWETDFGPRDTTSCPDEQGMDDHLSDPVEEVRELVRKAKWHLPEPVRTSREVFFDIDNLWKIEIRSTCDQAVEFMGGVVLTINDGLNRAAVALSRSIHECCIRFHYLSHHEDELPDWFRWQMSHDYHATVDTLLKYEAAGVADEQTLQRLREANQAVRDFLGEEPPKRSHPWKAPVLMLQDITSSLGPDAYGPMHRELIADPSDYVHIHVTGEPDWMRTLQLAEFSFATTIKRAMELCIRKGLLGSSAHEIEALCDQILR